MKNVCKVDGCGCAAETSGLRSSRNKETSAFRSLYCRKHLQWFLKYGTTDQQKFSQASLSERFWRGVKILGEDDCWLWQLSSKGTNGYGGIWDNTLKKTRLAHRVAYELIHSVVPDGEIVMHTCDNPRCVNPKHLVLGTHKLNGEDKAKKGRAAVNKFFGEQNPKSKLTLEQVKFIKANPNLGHKHIADMFGLSPNCIRGVRIGRTWKDV